MALGKRSDGPSGCTHSDEIFVPPNKERTRTPGVWKIFVPPNEERTRTLGMWKIFRFSAIRYLHYCPITMLIQTWIGFDGDTPPPWNWWETYWTLALKWTTDDGKNERTAFPSTAKAWNPFANPCWLRSAPRKLVDPNRIRTNHGKWADTFYKWGKIPFLSLWLRRRETHRRVMPSETLPRPDRRLSYCNTFLYKWLRRLFVITEYSFVIYTSCNFTYEYLYL